MNETIFCQGREVHGADIQWLRVCVHEHPGWSRHRITKHICEDWNWRTHAGQLKTFAARGFIDKLEARGFIELPPIRTEKRRPHVNPYPKVTHPDAAPVIASFSDISPVSVMFISGGSYDHSCFACYLNRHHYLGFNRTVGEHLEYLVRDAHGRDLACVLFGSTAWKSAPRDHWIGWDTTLRQRNLNVMTNNTRFLILPWVRIVHLTSHIPGGSCVGSCMTGYVDTLIPCTWLKPSWRKIVSREPVTRRPTGNCWDRRRGAAVRIGTIIFPFRSKISWPVRCARTSGTNYASADVRRTATAL